MAAPPALMDELVEQCLIRLPPDDPANIVRAALVSKGWRRIVADRSFSRRFRELHGRPLILGFLPIQTSSGSLFTPISTFHSGKACLRIGGGWHVIDSRHGCVLLSSSPSLYGTLHTRRRSDLAVWDRVSSDQLDLPELPPPQRRDWFGFTSKAVVLRASSSVRVILMDVTYSEACVHVYSSQACTWSHVASAAQDSPRRLLPRTPAVVAGNALYFVVQKSTVNGILKYDMGSHDISLVDLQLPSYFSRRKCRILLTTSGYDGLGIVLVEKNSRLHIWSRLAVFPSGVLRSPCRVIDLAWVLPVNSCYISTITFVHQLGAFFIMTSAGAFAIDLEYKWTSKVRGNNRVNYFVP